MLAFVRRCMLSCSKLGSGCHQPCAWGNTTPAIGDPTVELETAQLEKELEAEYYKIFPNSLDGTGSPDEVSWTESAARLSRLIKANYLEPSSLNSRRFFAAHRVLAKLGEGSLGIRLTCHFNLFVGTVAALGSETQRGWIQQVHARGELGCFLLTEDSAGVLSGLVVHTTVTWDSKERVLLLHTPEPEHAKKWISQGLASKWGVCIARLIIDGVDHGPHGFLVDMDAPGVTRRDMGSKTSFNALDNALVEFNQVVLKPSALLSKFCSISEEGEYCFSGDKPPTFLLVAQRLLSGRICISDAAITYFGTVLDAAHEYTSTRKVWIDAMQQRYLSDLPYMRQMFERFRAGQNSYRAFIQHLQDQYATAALNGEFSREIVSLIAAAKIEAVEFAINGLHLLRRNVGSYGLMHDSPFGVTNEILLCCRFAEGDSRILQQMLVRDLVRSHRSIFSLLKLMARFVCNSALLWVTSGSPNRIICNAKDGQLLRLLWQMRFGFSDRTAQLELWLEAGDLVYDLAKCHAHSLIFESVDRMCGDEGKVHAEAFKRSVLTASQCEMCKQY